MGRNAYYYPSRTTDEFILVLGSHETKLFRRSEISAIFLKDKTVEVYMRKIKIVSSFSHEEDAEKSFHDIKCALERKPSISWWW